MKQKKIKKDALICRDCIHCFLRSGKHRCENDAFMRIDPDYVLGGNTTTRPLCEDVNLTGECKGYRCMR